MITDSLTYRLPVPERLLSALNDTVPASVTGRGVMVANGFSGEMHETERVLNVFFSEWNLAIVTVVMLLFVIDRQLFPSRQRQMLSMVFGGKMSGQANRDAGSGNGFTAIAVYVSAVLSVSLFIQKFMVLRTGCFGMYNTFAFYGKLCLFMAAFILVKHCIINIMGWLFRTKDAARHYSGLHLSLLAVSSLLLLLLLLLLPPPYPMELQNSYIVLVAGTFIWGLVWILYLYRNFVETIVSSKLPSFYIFLYFCTLEIIPYSVVIWAFVKMMRMPCL